MRYVSDLECYNTLKLEYLEEQINAKGVNTHISEGSRKNLNWFAIGSLNESLYIKRNLMNSGHTVRIELKLDCHDKSSHKKDDSLATSIGKSLFVGFKAFFNCEFGPDQFPKNPGEKTAWTCESKKTYGMKIPTLKSFLLSYFEKFDFEIEMNYLSQNRLWDFTNCPEDAPFDLPFYLHVTQGLADKSNENRFNMSMRLDNQRFPKLAMLSSKTGLYTLAIAYCPKHKNQHITVGFEGREKGSAER